MRYWSLAVLSFLLVLGPAQAEMDLPAVADQLQAYEKQLITKANQDTRPSIELLRQVRDALAHGKTSTAIDALEILAGKHNAEGEGGFGTWLKLALAYQARMTNRTKSLTLSDGAATAYGAYKRADTDPDRIAALSALGGLLLRAAALEEIEEESDEVELNAEEAAAEEPPEERKNREAARAMAYTVFTELGRLVADDRYEATLKRLGPDFRLEKVTYPPRPAQYAADDYPCSETTIRKESAAEEKEQQPGGLEFIGADKAECEDNRAHYSCLVFTRSLGPNADEIAAAISVIRVREPSGAPAHDHGAATYPALVQDKRVCYGLEFGADYKFVVDLILKSASGETLKQKTVARLNMPDKGSLLGFKRGTYVLPKVGERSITIDTVNVKGAQLMLRRIGDRNLMREILLNHVVEGFASDSQDSCFVLNEVSEKIADGTLTLAASSKNKSIPLTLPIDKILDARRSWLDKDAADNMNALDIGVKDAKLSFKLHGDPAAAASKLGSQSGVFAVFGTVTDPVDDDPNTTDALDQETCTDRDFASQWFIITDTGLTLQTTHKNLYVMTRSLATTKAIKDVRIELVSRSGQVLAVGVTDERGIATFPARLGQGTGGNELVAVMSYNADDFSFLDKTGSEIDLSDRGFEGGVVPEAEVDAFIAPIRGIFRPGDVLEGLVLIRDLNGQALAKVPPFDLQLVEEGGAVLAAETVSGESGNGQDQATITSENGAYRFHMLIPQEVRQGTANLVVSVAGRVAGSTDSIEIRYFQPYTVSVQETKGTWSGEIDEAGMFTLKGDAHAEYLYGRDKSGHGTDAPAAGLPVEYEVRLVQAESPAPNCFVGFTFGHNASDYRPELFTGGGIPTGEDGSIHIEIVPSRLTQPHFDIPLKAEVTIKVLDANGVASTQKIEVPVKRLGRHWIGAKVGGPQALSPGRPDTNAAMQPMVIQIVALDSDGKPETLGVPTTINRINNGFVWSFDGRSWDYIPDPGRSRTKIADVTLKYDAQEASDACPKSSVVSVPLGEIGNYLLELKGKDSLTELNLHKGWTTAKDGSLEPDSLVVWVRKKEVSKGDSIEVGVDTPYRAGTVFGEVIANGTIHATFEAAIDKEGRASAKLTVDQSWPEGAMHVYVTALRMAEVTATEPGPARAIGGTMIRIGADRGDPKLSIKAPERIQTLLLKDAPQVEVSVDGLDEDAWLALAVVDEGILSVTRYPTPSPVEHFFGRRWFDLQVFDTYGRLLFGKFGGDALIGLRGMAYQPTDLVTWMSQIQKAKDGRGKFRIPLGKDGIPENFQGEIRLMAWAWDGEKFAVAEHHIDVRDPIVVGLSAPQRMAPNDIAVMPLRVKAVDLAQQVSIEARIGEKGALTFPQDVPGADVGEVCDGGAPLDECRRYAVDVKPNAPATLIRIPIKATSVADLGGEAPTITLSYKLSDTLVVRNWTVQVRPPYPPVAIALRSKEFAPGQSLTIDADYFEKVAAEMDEHHLRLTVRIAKQDSLPTSNGDGVASMALPLDQRASTAQLILANRSLNIPDLSVPEGEAPSAARLAALARDILLMQDFDGSFRASLKPGVRYLEHDGTYKGEEQPDWVGQTAFALDVLSQINAITPTAGDAAVNRAAGYLLSELNWILTPDDDGDRAKCTRSRLYAANVLAKLSRLGGGFLQRVGEACMEYIDNDPIGKLMLASAYKEFGLTKEVDRLMAGINGDTLATSGAAPADVARAVALYMENQPAGVQPILISTGEKPMLIDEATASWWTRAQVALLKSLRPESVAVGASDAEITPASIGRVPFPFGIDIQRLSLEQVRRQPVTIVNRSDKPLKLSFLGEGIPTSLDKVSELRYAVTLSFMGRDGPITPKDGVLEVKQFEPVYCLVAINQKHDGYTAPQQLAAVQILPTGFEVLDEYYKFAWEKTLGKAVDASAISVIAYAETQPDRWIALPSRKDSGVENQLIGFSLRPTMQGNFALPSLVVRDLRNPARAGWTEPLRVAVMPAK